MTLEELKQINEEKIEMYAKKHNNFEELEIAKQLKIHEKIKKLFNNNPSLFFEIPMEEALKILSKLVPEEKLKETYTSLIEPEKYKKLRKNFEI